MAVSQSSSLSSIATDVLRNFKFQVIYRPASGKAVTMGFMTVDGLAMTIEVIPYREGGYNTTTQNMPGQASFNPVTCSGGVHFGSQKNLQWAQQLFRVIQGSGGAPPGNNFRSNVDVQILDYGETDGSVVVKSQFRLYNAWPTTLAYSTLDAGASQLFIEQMTLTYEGWDMVTASGPGTATAPNFAA